MRFEYSSWVGLSSDTGEPTAFFRPTLKLTVHGPDGRASYDALLDTGADTCLFPRSVAVDLGIEECETEGPDSTTASGDPLPSTFADVVVEVTDGGSPLQWTMRAYFHETSAETDELLILGHAGFLEYFTTIFIGEEFACELHPNEYLPRLQQP